MGQNGLRVPAPRLKEDLFLTGMGAGSSAPNRGRAARSKVKRNEKSLECSKTRGRVLGLAFEIGRFGHFSFRAVDFSLAICNLGQGTVANSLERPEEKGEINVKQKNETHRAEQEFLDLIFGKFRKIHFFVLFGSVPLLRPVLQPRWD